MIHDEHTNAKCARSPRLQLGRVRQLSVHHAAMDGRCLVALQERERQTQSLFHRAGYPGSQLICVFCERQY